MSANNFISVEQHGKHWEVWIKDVETGVGHSEGMFNTKLEAIEKAQEIQSTEIIEYGISISNAQPPKNNRGK